MSFLLDIIIVAIIAVTMFLSARNGFVKTAISAASFILAIIITAAFASPLANALKETSIAGSVKDSTKEIITNVLVAENIGIDDLLDGNSKEFNSLIGIAEIEIEDLRAWYSENIANGESAESIIADRLAEPLTDILATIVALIILYIGTQILLSVAGFFLNKLAKLPILKTANKGLGIALGVVLSLFRVCFFCFLVGAIIENAAIFPNREFIEAINPDNTLLFNIFSKIDIYAFFL